MSQVLLEREVGVALTDPSENALGIRMSYQQMNQAMATPTERDQVVSDVVPSVSVNVVDVDSFVSSVSDSTELTGMAALLPGDDGSLPVKSFHVSEFDALSGEFGFCSVLTDSSCVDLDSMGLAMTQARDYRFATRNAEPSLRLANAARFLISRHPIKTLSASVFFPFRNSLSTEGTTTSGSSTCLDDGVLVEPETSGCLPVGSKSSQFSDDLSVDTHDSLGVDRLIFGHGVSVPDSADVYIYAKER